MAYPGEGEGSEAEIQGIEDPPREVFFCQYLQHNSLSLESLGTGLEVEVPPVKVPEPEGMVEVPLVQVFSSQGLAEATGKAGLRRMLPRRTGPQASRRDLV